VQERVVERIVETSAELPVRGHVVGTVVESGSNAPVAGAIVHFEGRGRNDIVADASGRFRSYTFEPGEVQMSASHPDYTAANCVATIPAERPAAPEAAQAAQPATDASAPVADAAGATPAAEPTPEELELEVEVTCELPARPRNGSATLHVVTDQGPLAAPVTITIAGPVSRPLTTDATGNARLADVAPGHYTASIEAEGFFARQQEFDVAPRGDDTVEITLMRRPARSLARITGRRIQISRQVNFVTDSDQILPTSDPLLYELADLFAQHPELRSVEIEGHTDDRGGSEHNLDLSQRRAEAVRQWLIAHGVSAARLTAHGYGSQRALVPNITPANRARNRRVQFTIRDADAAQP